MPTIYVCFLENDTELMEAHILNKMATMLAPKTANAGSPKIHVELFFPNTSSNYKNDVLEGKACSIYYSGQVFLVQKKFSRKQWSFRKLDVNKGQYDKVFNYCQAHVGDGFNHLSYFTYPVNCQQITPYWPTHFGYKPKFFCSEICVEALKAGGVVDKESHSSIHPQELFQMLQENSTPDCVRNYDNMKLSFA